MLLSFSSSSTLTDVTFSGNSAFNGGGMFLNNSSDPTLTNSILWGNSPEEIYFWEFDSASHSITISYSDIQGGEAGIVANDGTVYWEDGNIDADPLFCDAENGDLTIQSDSPLLGAGQDGANIGALGVGCEEPLSIVDNIIPNTYTLSSYPNPFNPTTTITFTIPEFGLTTITAYDLTGRELETLTNEVLSIGNYSINWNASSYPSGVYLIKMDSGQIIHSRKFQQVSGEFLDDLKHNPKTIDSKFKKYSSVVNNFLNEYLGKYPVNSINEKVLYEYKKWRKSYWKNKDTVEHTYTRNGKTIKSQRNYLKNKPVSLSTLHKEDVVLRQILEHARLSGDIDNNKVIKIKSESFKSSRRPSFTLDEWKKILKVSSYRCSNERLWKNKNNEPNKKFELK